MAAEAPIVVPEGVTPGVVVIRRHRVDVQYPDGGSRLVIEEETIKGFSADLRAESRQNIINYFKVKEKPSGTDEYEAREFWRFPQPAEDK